MANSSNEAIVTGLFRDRAAAECAYNAAGDRGYSKDDLNVMMSEETRDRHYAGGAGVETELGTKALEGIGAGSAIGGTAGAIIGAVVAVGTSIAVPGLGLLVAGPIAGALAGAGAGGIAGGLVGALVGYGIPEERVKAYESGVKAGGTVLSVRPRSDEDAAYLEARWKECGGEEVYSNFGAADADAAARPGREGAAVIPVVEGGVRVGRSEVEGGGVRAESRVEERPVEEDVRLREEHVRVDRRPVDRPVTDADMAAFKEGTIEISASAEVPVVEKQARVVEEVVVGKDVKERAETVRETVRSTDVDVDRIGAEGGGAYGAYEADFRDNFETTYSRAGRGYEAYAPAYRYGYDLANDPRYGSANDWSEVEAGARRGWESSGQGAWEDFKDSVRYAWDRVRGRASGRARA